MVSDCGCDYAACDMVSPTAIKLWQMLACKNVFLRIFLPTLTLEKQFPEHISFHHKVRPSPGKALLFVRSDRHLILCGICCFQQASGTGQFSYISLLIINFGLFQILLLL